jgi:hypothetical protein
MKINWTRVGSIATMAVAAGVPVLLFAVPAFAAGANVTTVTAPILATLKSGVTAVGGLGTAGGGLMVAYHALARNLNDDPQSVAHHTASIKKVLVGTAIVMGSGLLASVAGAIL